MKLTVNAAFAVSLLAGYLHMVRSQSPFIISDDRVRSMDISPTLGRGYSIMTNTYNSICLVVDTTTVPSFNYDYYFTELNSSDSTSAVLSGKISDSLGFSRVQASMDLDTSKTTNSNGKEHKVWATMKIERYYSSVKEEVSPLDNDAFSLLQSEDYVGFFKACGPNYIRSIRRAQEVLAYFKFKTTSTARAQTFTRKLKNIKPADVDPLPGDPEPNSGNSELTIQIIGYGLGLSQEGSGTMVAMNLAEYQGVMKFAFRSMTVNENAHNLGMVYGMEVVPWVNNLAFQVAAKVGEANIIIPLAQNLIEMAVLQAGQSGAFDVTNAANKYMCASSAEFKMDKWGYCCEASDLWKPDISDYDEYCTANHFECVCRPTQNLDKSMVKDNMSNNGEFIARLDMAMRYKLAQIGTLEKCISAVRALPKDYDQIKLKQNDMVKHDKAITININVAQLRRAVDPLNDYGLMKHLAKEMDTWIEMFYSPCLQAIYGSGPDSLFMAYPWYQHSECMKISCLMNNMRWDQDGSGECVPSLITGTSAPTYARKAADTECVMDDTIYDSVQKCKYDVGELAGFTRKVQQCWSKTNSISGIDHLINYFCNPVMTNEELILSTADFDDSDCTPFVVKRHMTSMPSDAPSMSSPPSVEPSEEPSMQPSLSNSPSSKPSTSSRPSTVPRR